MAEPSPSEFQPYRRVQAAKDKELKAILEATARQIQKRIKSLPVGIGGQVRAAQLRTTLAAVRKLQRAMWTGRVSPLVMAGWKDAEDAAESAVEAMTRVAYAALPDAAAEELVRGLRLAAESGLKSDAARKRRELSERVYKLRALHEGKVEEIIRAGLISNLSAKELADSAYEYVSPTAKGGASYAALRLARTEINNAFHERQLQGATRPGVKAVKWNLSGSHVVPDECNTYAAHNGNGHFAPDKVPDKPHPQCFCYLTYITQSPEEFRKALTNGDFDDEIERRTRENMARLGQPVGDIPASRSPARGGVVIGKAVHDLVPRGLFKRGTLTSSQTKSLKTYETGWFMVINDWLRRPREPEDDEDLKSAKVVEDIREAMNDSKLTKDAQVWRGMFNARTVFGDAFDNDLTGFAWDDLAFGSTTTIDGFAKEFVSVNGKPVPNSVVMKVFVPAGTKALQTSTHSEGSKDNGPQGEITLADGMTWSVTKDLGVASDGIRYLEVEVYPIGGKPRRS